MVAASESRKSSTYNLIQSAPRIPEGCSGTTPVDVVPIQGVVTMRIRSLVPTLVAAFLVLAASASVEAQWINHPTAGTPRTADGKPDLTAPVPRAADGKPDLSGVWAINGLGYSTNITSVKMLPWAQKIYEA